MPTTDDLGKLVKEKYPGAYDDLPDGEVGRLVKMKYPGAYADFQSPPGTSPRYPQLGAFGEVGEQLVDLGKMGLAGAINTAGTTGGAALGGLTSPVTGPLGPAVGAMGGSFAARKANVALGLEDPGTVGDVLSVAVPALGSIPALWRGIMAHTKGAQQLARTQALGKVEQEADAARMAVKEGQATEQQAAQLAAIQARRQALAEKQALETQKLTLTEQATKANTASEKLQEAIQKRLGVSGKEVTGQITERMAQDGGPLTEEAIDAAYKGVSTGMQGAMLPRAGVDAAIADIPPRVRKGLTVLGTLPKAPTGGGGDPGLRAPLSTDLTYPQMRDFQKGVGEEIRVLERKIARGADVGELQQLAGLKKVYAATYKAFDEAVTQGNMPAEALLNLKVANYVNRLKAASDRIDTLMETKATVVTPYGDLFDANALNAAIKGDGFLVKTLKEHEVFDDITALLQRIAQAQKGKLDPIKAATGDLTQAGKEISREQMLRTLAKQEEQIVGKAAGTEQLKGIDVRLAAQKAAIDQQYPAVEGMGKWLLSPRGQKHLEQLFSTDPFMTPQKMAILNTILRAAEQEREDGAVPAPYTPPKRGAPAQLNPGGTR